MIESTLEAFICRFAWVTNGKRQFVFACPLKWRQTNVNFYKDENIFPIEYAPSCYEYQAQLLKW